MTVGILGLGLIGGSFARAFSKAGHRVLGCNADPDILEFAKLAGAVHGDLSPASIPCCDLIILAIYPEGCVSWLEENGVLINNNTLVIQKLVDKMGDD